MGLGTEFKKATGAGQALEGSMFKGLSSGKSPKMPKKTAQELAIEKRQKILLNKEIEETEAKQKALARAKLGAQSLLSGAARTQAEAATRGAGSGSGASILGSSLSGSGSAGGAGGGSTPTTGIMSTGRVK